MYIWESFYFIGKPDWLPCAWMSTGIAGASAATSASTFSSTFSLPIGCIVVSSSSSSTTMPFAPPASDQSKAVIKGPHQCSSDRFYIGNAIY